MFRKPNVLLGLGTVLFVLGFALPLALPVPDMTRGVLFGLGGALFLGAFVCWLRPDGCDDSTPGLRRRYLREFVPAMIAYVVLLSISLVLLKRVEEQAVRAMVALLPVVPLPWSCAPSSATSAIPTSCSARSNWKPSASPPRWFRCCTWPAASCSWPG